MTKTVSCEIDDILIKVMRFKVRKRKLTHIEVKSNLDDFAKRS